MIIQKKNKNKQVLQKHKGNLFYSVNHDLLSCDQHKSMKTAKESGRLGGILPQSARKLIPQRKLLHSLSITS